MTSLDQRVRLGRERVALQSAVLIAALVPVSAGLAGIVLGPELLGATAADVPSFDSHLRYLSGLLLGIGLAFWSLVPRIERAGAVFRPLTFLVVAGGVARLLSLAIVGAPSRPMLGGLIMELIVTPLLCLWQARIARESAT
jgi:hypothetical protein